MQKHHVYFQRQHFEWFSTSPMKIEIEIVLYVYWWGEIRTDNQNLVPKKISNIILYLTIIITNLEIIANIRILDRVRDYSASLYMA